MAIAFEALDAWAPSFTTAALSIALTVVVVQEIVRRSDCSLASHL
jgi:hypothetical protein